MRPSARVSPVTLVAAAVISAGGAASATPAATTTAQFGKTVPGSTSAKPGAGYKFGSRYALPQTGTLVDFNFYAAGGSAAQKFIPLLYTVGADGNPANLVAQGVEVTVQAGQAAGWVSSSLPATTLTAGQYVLALLSGPTGGSASIFFDPVPSSGWFNRDDYPTPSTTWGTIATEAQELSFYVDYAPSTGGVGRFGKTTAGGASQTPGANYKFGSAYPLAEPGTLVDFKFYAAGGTADQKFVPVVYGLDGVSPGALLAQGAEVTVAAGQAPGWVTSTLPAVTLPPGTYVLALLSGPTGKRASVYFDNTTSTSWFNQNAYPTPSPTWGPTSTEGREYSYYVDYARTDTVPPPVNMAPPTISGAAELGQALTASPGAWSGSPSFAYRWQRCDGAGKACVDVGGATSSTYLLGGADLGATLRVVVTATGVGGQGTATSAVTPVVVDPAGIAQFGQATAGAAFAAPGAGTKFGTIFSLGETGTLVDFGFYAAGGAADQQFVPVVYSVGAAGEPQTLLAQGTPVTVAVGQPPGWVTVQLPRVRLTAGSYLLGLLAGPVTQGAYIYFDHVVNSGWFNRNPYPTPSATFGASSRSDQSLSVHVDYKPGLLPMIASPPTVTGAAIAGQTLSASPGTWSPALGNTYTYQWLRCAPTPEECVQIDGATATTYTPTSADAVTSLRVRVTATRAEGAGSATSAPTAPVAAGLPASMAALGDSITLAWGSTGPPGSRNPSASWSTGTDPAVNSHYLRLLALSPALAGHNANYAAAGSRMKATLTQAESAVADGAAYVTILSGTNDVCKATTTDKMTKPGAFKTQLTSTLATLTGALPTIRILVASIPDWYGLWNAFRTDPAATSAWATNAVCPLIFGATTTDAARQAAAQRITDLNAAAAGACAAFSQCTYDGGAVHGLSFTAADLAFDYFHPSVAGQARLAAATWNGGLFGAP